MSIYRYSAASESARLDLSNELEQSRLNYHFIRPVEGWVKRKASGGLNLSEQSAVTF